MFNNKNYSYDRVQLEEVSSEEEYRSASPVVRSPHNPFPQRKKPSVRTHQPQIGLRCCCRNPLCLKCVYLLVVGLVMVVAMLVVLNIINHDSSSDRDSDPVNHQKPLTPSLLSLSSSCSHLSVRQVWVQNLPQLLTETAVRLIDVNRDGISDAILGFATGASGAFADPDLLCKIYFAGQVPCFGGVLALDGVTGNEIWRHWSEQEVFALNCNVDINADGVADCACSGRMGMFELISGSDGRRLWVFDHHASKVSISNFYTPQFIHDVDGDDVQDIITIHGGDPLREPGAHVSYAGRLMLFSGATGQVITWSEVPDGMESYYSPQVYFDSHGEKVVLFGTGGETHGGAFWLIKLDDFIRGDMQKARCLYKDSYKGVMTPPVLVDITRDGVLDIVIATFNSTVLAIDGGTYDILWNFSMPMSETYATPAAGFFNDDDVPDFLIIFNHGPTYPVYYYSEVTVLDGRTGQPLVEPFIRHSGTIHSSPLTVSVEGTAQDMFLYFASDCLNHEGKSTKFSFTKATYQSSKSKADLCMVRFNTSSFSRLYAMSYLTGSPGSIIYDSMSHTSEEYMHSVNTSILAKTFLEQYPETAQYVIDRQRAMEEDEQKNDKSGDPKATDSADAVSHQQSEIGENKGEQTTDHFPTSTSQSQVRPTVKNWRTHGTSQHSETEEQESWETQDTQSFLDTFGSDTFSLDNFLVNNGQQSGGSESYHNIETHLFEEFHTDELGKGSPEPYTEEPVPNIQPGQSKKEKLMQLVKEMMRENGYSNWNSERTGKGDRTRQHSNNQHSRAKRHAGPHDSGGLQRLIATGTLAPSLHRDGHGIDLIFPVYWFYPPQTEILTEDEQKCVDSKMETEGDRMNSDSKYFGMDHDAYDRVVEDECKGNNTDSTKLTEHILRTDPLQMYPFNLHMGEMTVYRLHLSCGCTQKPCTRILPFKQQGWPAYLGARANSIYVHRRTDANKGN